MRAMNWDRAAILRVVSLALLLFGFWLVLSGHYTLWLVASGAIVSLLLAVAGTAFGFADEEGHPVERFLAGLRYWPWLAVEILKSSLDVARVILHPALPISPKLFTIKIGPRSPVGVATYANSITLTPGTISVEVDREHDTFLVHALTAEGEAALREGGMDRRVVAFEGRTP